MEEKELSFYDFFIPITIKKAVFLISIIGLLVFGNSFFNPFIFDDIPQIVQNTSVHTIYSISSFFISSISLSHHGFPLLHLYYKPLLFTFYAIFWSVFQGNPFGFHLFQTLLHITNSILVFLLFTKFFKKPLAFLLSVVFLTHPLQSETVIYIANLQDILFVFFGLVALHITLSTKLVMKLFYKTILTSLFLLFSLLSKETGILFFFIVALSIFFQKTKRKQIIFSMVITTFTYLLLRFFASYSSTSTLTLSLMQKLPLRERVVSIPKIIEYYLSHFFLPLHLATGQAWIIRQINISDFWIPLMWELLFFVGILAAGFFIWKQQRKLFTAYIFFFFWFLFGLVTHLQLIPLDLTVADRWFYFPFIGLLGMIGIFGQSFLTHLSNTKRHLLTILFVCILCILSILTMIRNSQWQSPFTLYAHDIAYVKDNPAFLSYYGGLLMERGEYDKAKPYLEKSLQLDSSLGSNSINLGAWEEHANNFNKAKQIYQNMIQNPTIPPSFKRIAYENLARVLLFKIKDISQAEQVIYQGLHIYTHDELLMEYLAMIFYIKGNQQHAEELLIILTKTSPTHQLFSLLHAMQTNSVTLPN